MLAILEEDGTKIKNATAEDIETLINTILIFLNVKISEDPDEKEEFNEQMVLVGKLLLSEFYNLTLEEVNEAFGMLLARKFPQIKVLRMLDAVYVGEVLSAYREYKNEALRVYESKKRQLINQTAMLPAPDLSPEIQRKRDVGIVCQAYIDYQAKKSVNDSLAYDILFDMGYLPDSPEFKKKIFQLTKEQLKKRYALLSTSSRDQLEQQKWKRILRETINNTNIEIVLYSKILVLNLYFKKLKESNSQLDDDLNFITERVDIGMNELNEHILEVQKKEEEYKVNQGLSYEGYVQQLTEACKQLTDDKLVEIITTWAIRNDQKIYVPIFQAELDYRQKSIKK